MRAITSIRWVSTLVFLLAASTSNASTLGGAFGYDYPGIGAPSYPYFLDIGETIKIKSKGKGDERYWILSGKGSAASFWGASAESIDLKSGKIWYQANFNADGQLITSSGTRTLTNFLEISGALPAGTFGNTSWTDQPKQLLLSATLLDSNAGNGTPDLVGVSGPFALGFKTQFTGGWAADNIGLTGGSTGENLWLSGLSGGFQNLVKALDGDGGNGTFSSLFGKSKFKINDVTSVASVPVPGAVWLFGAGLVALFSSSRKSAGSSVLAI